MKTSPELGRLVDQALAEPVGPFAFSSVLERLFQLDIHKQRTRHLTRCLLIGTLSYDSFLIWWWLLLQDALPWAATQMLGIATPFALLVVLLLQVVPTRWRETLASLPFYVGLVVVYNMVINGPPGREMNQTLFIFTWPLMLAFVNTCMKSPLLPALVFNGFALSMIALAVHEAPVSPIVGGLMMTNAIVMAFFSLLASYWLNVEGRRSYLYKLREEVRLASLNSANQDLQILSETDSLTGLANRRQLHLLLEAFWQRRLAGEQGAVLLIDVDHFKRYNDYYGHLAGDDCLRTVARALAVGLGPGDRIGRYGGEEFVVLLDRVDPATALDVAENILQRVRDLQIPHQGRQDDKSQVTVSIGIARSGLAGLSTAEDLLDCADRALYRAKRDGRDRVFEGGIDAILGAPLDHAELLTPEDVRKGLVGNEFLLHYQPIYRVEPKQVTGYEALLRWQHPTLGLVSPEVFIPLAEQGNFIIALGEWVVKEACLAASQWPPHLSVSINLSPLQFADPMLHERVSAALRLSRLAPNRLVLEVTEGVELVIDTRTRQSFALLQLLGIRMALDDFGSGFAGLGPILELPFQLIKIDRRILAIQDEEQRGEVLSSLLLLGKAMKLEVLCEGVETPEQLALLQQLGVRLAQGYLLGRPAAAPSGQQLQLMASLEA
ncbi:MAG: GGDEF-domain containing protein [Pseudomonas sp. PGPPP4]|uniref:putative bifunctional diguanylate cyclase/phosphodiesterase n=1 Tax=Pseudomonas TaxID=286 RepID=UPI000BC65F06|nr:MULTISPECIES: GGDEF domain-containing phosphodiesterase [Pseudomonas]MCI1012134.1 EAL domain-containing protein [Pseudomonas oryzihabitans]OYT79122.1 MAG: GGDEF-domain containing protein [Pseudomonas sp. PGPPP4]